MKLLVLGATGKTGREVVRLALENGLEVTAFTRSPEMLPRHPLLTPFIGNAEDQKQVEAAATGQGAVISVLGHTSTVKSSALTTATQGLVAVLPENTKVISLTGFGVSDPHDPRPSLTGRLLNAAVKLVPGRMYEDGARHVEILRESNLAWTVIRPALLSAGPAIGRYEMGYFRLTPGDTVPRADIATAMLAALTDNTWLRQAPMIRRGKL